MKLNELLLHLCEGEFANLVVGTIVDEVPKLDNYSAILRTIDISLLEMHKRFPLKQREVFIQQYDHIQRYELHSRYAQTNTASNEPYKYIVDSEWSAFIDEDFIQLEELFNEQGEPVPLNDRSQQYSMYTSGFNTIQVPYPDSANAFSAIYRAGHSRLDSRADPSTVDVSIPFSHVEALLLYIAGRHMASSHPEESQLFMMRFETSCAKLIELNLRNEDNSPFLQFSLGGWV